MKPEDRPDDYPIKPLVDKLPEEHPFRLFTNFARVVWNRLNLPDLTPIQADICDSLQFGPSHLQVQAFRGAGKTYASAAYICWRLWLNPEKIILILSAAKNTTDQICRFTRRLIDEVPDLHHLKPDVSRGDQDSSISFQVGCATVKKSPSVISKGITGTITGDRASLVILDDVEIVNNSETPAMREKLLGRIEEISALMLPPAPHLDVYPTVRVLGTPQTAHTIYRTIERLGYHTQIWPIEKPTPEVIEGYGTNPDGSPRLSGYAREYVGDPGTPLEPSRFSPVEIAALRMKFTRPSYNRQYLLSTDLADAERFPLKIKDLQFADFEEKRAHEIYMHGNHPACRIQEDNPGLPGDGFYRSSTVSGEVVPVERTILAVDPSGRGADETAIAVVSSLSGYVLVHSVRGIPGGYSKPTLEAIAREAKKYNVHQIVIESNFGMGAITELLKPILQRIHPVTIEETRNTQRKELRILETLSPLFESNRLIFHNRVIEQQKIAEGGDIARATDKSLFYQITHLEETKGCLAHDDRVDALELGCRQLVDTLNRDALVVQRQRDLEYLDKWINDDEDKIESHWGSRESAGPCPYL